MNTTVENSFPFVSIIMPARNAEAYIAGALEGLFHQDYPHFEVIVVSDGSTDRTNEICQRYPCRLIIQEWKGIGAAKNAGAAVARGQILYFTDADVLVRPDTLRRVVHALLNHPEVVGLTGCYSAESAHDDFFSKYKNALHHYVHRSNGAYTVNLFGAHSAIWKHIFDRLGGFNPRQTVLEDIELGYRIARAGYRVLNASDIDVVHRKKYSFGNLVRSDVFGRAIPWTIIMLKNRRLFLDLNTRPRNIFSLGAVWSVLLAFWPVSPVWSAAWVCFSFVVFCLLNRELLGSLFRQTSWYFLAKACFFNYFSYFYQGVGVALGVIEFLSLETQPPPRPSLPVIRVSDRAT